MKKIFMISREYPPSTSGASIAIHNYIKDITSHNFFVISYFKPKKSKKNFVVKKIQEKWKHHRYLSAARFVSLSILNSFRNFDCIIGNALIGSLCGTIIKILRGKPLISMVYDVDSIYEEAQAFSKTGKFVRKLVYKLILKYSDKIIVSSEKVKKDIMKIFGNELAKNVKVLPIGVEIKSFKKIEKPRNKKIVITVGGIMEKRGLEYLVEAFESVVKKVNNAELWIIGPVIEKSYYEKIDNLIKTLHLQKYIRFTGRIPYFSNGVNIFSYYDICDIFVVASYHSAGYSLTCLEASLMGKPIVANDLIEETGVVVNKKTALIVPRKNSKKLAKAIISLLRNKKLREKLGNNGKIYGKKFSPDEITKQYEQIINTVLESS